MKNDLIEQKKLVLMAVQCLQNPALTDGFKTILLGYIDRCECSPTIVHPVPRGLVGCDNASVNQHLDPVYIENLKAIY